MTTIATILALSVLVVATRVEAEAEAEADLSRANVIDVNIEMGSNDGGMLFSPDKREFLTGQAYRLILINGDEIKHEIAPNEMGERIFSRPLIFPTACGNPTAGSGKLKCNSRGYRT
jgi:uncharacterized cupredoxin-like copper-binding protein